MNRNRQTAYLCAIGVAVIWGAAFPIVKPALTYLAAEQFLFLRFVLAALIMLPILYSALARGKFPFKKLLTILIIESLSMLALLIMYAGLKQTQAIQGAFIINTKPIFMTLAGVFFLREVEENQELMGLVLAVVGTALILASPLIFGLSSAPSGSPVTALGNGLILLAVLIEVFYMLKVKKYYQGLDKTLVVAVSAILGASLFGALNFSLGTLPTIDTIRHWEVILAVVYMGSLGTAIAFALNLRAYTLIEASEASLFEYLQPLIYIPLTVLWLKEVLLPTQLIGIAVIGFGVYLAGKRSRGKTLNTGNP